MPFMLGLIPLLTAAGGLAGTGLSIANAVSGSPAAPTAPGATPPTAQALAQQKAAIAQQDPNLQASGSGELSPAYTSLISQILAGTIGQPGSTAAGNATAGFTPGTGQSLNQNFTPANSQSTNAAVQGGQINLSDYVNTSIP